MKIIVAKHAGFCFGVKRAVDGVLELAKSGERVYTWGPLIHNETVVSELRKKGIIPIESLDEIDETEENSAIIVIRTHGVSPEVQRKLEQSGHRIVDFTCPNVKKIHKIVSESDTSHKVLIVGRADHPEVIGIKGYADENSAVVSSPTEVKRAIGSAGSILMVSQTTFNRSELQKIYREALKTTPSVRLCDTICATTVDRQKEAAKLAKKSDIVIVVGDKTSANSLKLAEISHKYCKNLVFIERYSQNSIEMPKNCDIISVISGASTPIELVDEVAEMIKSIPMEEQT